MSRDGSPLAPTTAPPPPPPSGIKGRVGEYPPGRQPTAAPLSPEAAATTAAAAAVGGNRVGEETPALGPRRAGARPHRHWAARKGRRTPPAATGTSPRPPPPRCVDRSAGKGSVAGAARATLPGRREGWQPRRRPSPARHPCFFYCSGFPPPADGERGRRRDRRCRRWAQAGEASTPQADRPPHLGGGWGGLRRRGGRAALNAPALCRQPALFQSPFPIWGCRLETALTTPLGTG